MINRNHFNFYKASCKDIEPVTCKNEQNDQVYETGDTENSTLRNDETPLP